MLALEATGLGKTYRPFFSRHSHQALAGVDLAVPAGARVALLGANGSGKTTLLKICATLVRPTTGTVRLMGHDAVHRSRTVRRLMTFVSGDGRGLYPKLSAWQNASFFGALYGLPDRQVRRRFDDLIAAWRLEPLLGRPVQLLSTGERQRLALALALLPEPDILLLDEPTRSLDPLTASTMWPLLGGSKRTVLWSTHAPEESFAHATSLIVLQQGRVVAQGEPGVVAPHGRNSLSGWYQR